MASECALEHSQKPGGLVEWREGVLERFPAHELLLDDQQHEDAVEYELVDASKEPSHTHDVNAGAHPGLSRSVLQAETPRQPIVMRK